MSDEYRIVFFAKNDFCYIFRNWNNSKLIS